jgi:hypothetical protein
MAMMIEDVQLQPLYTRQTEEHDVFLLDIGSIRIPIVWSRGVAGLDATCVRFGVQDSFGVSYMRMLEPAMNLDQEYNM